jgi:hypothetical protein
MKASRISDSLLDRLSPAVQQMPAPASKPFFALPDRVRVPGTAEYHPRQALAFVR